MITPAVIKELYKTYRNRPASPSLLNLELLINETAEHHNIEIHDDRLIINSMSETSPFHRLPLCRIHAIENFEEEVAIVLHSSIIFLNKKDDGINVNIKMTKPSLWQRFLLMLRKK